MPYDGIFQKVNAALEGIDLGDNASRFKLTQKRVTNLHFQRSSSNRLQLYLQNKILVLELTPSTTD